MLGAVHTSVGCNRKKLIGDGQRDAVGEDEGGVEGRKENKSACLS
jgi:hypothetical protein